MRIAEVPGGDPERVIRRMEDFYSTQVRPKPGLEKFLSILENGGCLDVCCHFYPPAADGESSENCGHRPVFPGIITSADAGNHKRDSADIYEMYHAALSPTNGTPWVFEDALYAIRTAKAAGFRVAGVYDAI